MLIFDEIKKNDPQLRFVAYALAAGFFILLAGLWWVQIVRAGEYKGYLQTQSYRTIRTPAMRGRILDCEGRVLAENSPRYNLSLYFGELSAQIETEYNLLAPPKVQKEKRPFWEFWKRPVASAKGVSQTDKDEIAIRKWRARYYVADSLVAKMSQTIGR